MQAVFLCIVAATAPLAQLCAAGLLHSYVAVQVFPEHKASHLAEGPGNWVLLQWWQGLPTTVWAVQPPRGPQHIAYNVCQGLHTSFYTASVRLQASVCQSSQRLGPQHRMKTWTETSTDSLGGYTDCTAPVWLLRKPLASMPAQHATSLTQSSRANCRPLGHGSMHGNSISCRNPGQGRQGSFRVSLAAAAAAACCGPHPC